MTEDASMLVALVILDKDRRVLLDGSGMPKQLLEVEIARFTRPAHSITRAARDVHRLDLFQIMAVEPSRMSHPNSETVELIAICRLTDSEATLPHNLVWDEHGQLTLETSDQQLLDIALSEFDLYDSGTRVSNFGRYNALDDVRSWYAPVLESFGVRETKIQQWNADPWFALFRVAVEPLTSTNLRTPKALWFKAVGEPNTREYAVTQALAEECPYWFPKIIATAPQWHAWMTYEVDGHELDDEPDGHPWALTARILAKVQRRFVGQEDRLLALGCRDWRIPQVLNALDPFFDDMDEIMQRQISGPGRILNREELRQLNIRCKDLCRRVEDVDVPYSIAHGDFSPCNVIVTTDGWPILIDWAEAYLTFPFISWEYLWNRMVKDHPTHSLWHERMLRNYAYRVWEPLLTKTRVDAGLRLSPAVAVLIVAMYGMNDPIERRNRNAEHAKRSLVRRLSRELDVLDQVTSEPAGAL